jgi:hypothetical protein
MINKTACREVLEFLDAIEGQGYGGMASFEIARLHARIALEMAGKQDGAIDGEEIAKVLAYDLENGPDHGARVATTPHLDNYHINGHVNLLALGAAVVARLEQRPKPSAVER